MKRGNLILILSASALLLLGLALYVLVVRPRLEQPLEVIEPPAPPTTVTEDVRNSAFNLYFHAPLRLAGISRVELTLTRIDAVQADGNVYTVSDEDRRITVQTGIIQKVESARIRAGETESLILEFGPTARIIGADRNEQIAFLPEREMEIPIEEDIRTSGTLGVLIGLPRNTAFGERNGVITLDLPSSTEPETTVMGGFFLNDRSVGETYEAETSDIREAILADIGLDIAPREGPRGSGGFGAADEAPPEPTVSE